MFGIGRRRRVTQEAQEPLHCSFCDRSQASVRKLIAGPTATICDESDRGVLCDACVLAVQGHGQASAAQRGD